LVVRCRRRRWVWVCRVSVLSLVWVRVRALSGWRARWVRWVVGQCPYRRRVARCPVLDLLRRTARQALVGCGIPRSARLLRSRCSLVAPVGLAKVRPLRSDLQRSQEHTTPP
jgi:hypothetical protein